MPLPAAPGPSLDHSKVQALHGTAGALLGGSHPFSSGSECYYYLNLLSVIIISINFTVHIFKEINHIMIHSDRDSK